MGKAKLITVDGLVIALCSGVVLGYLLHLLLQQAATMLTIVQSVNQ